MLTIQEVEGHLKRLSYKPGWSFEVYQGKWEGAHIVINTEIDDSYNPGEMVVLDIHSRLPRVAMQNTDTLEDWLAERLAVIEVHEMREFFKRDGKPVFNPHEEFAERDK